MSKDKKRFELPIVGNMDMDRRQALKIMAIAAGCPHDHGL